MKKLFHVKIEMLIEAETDGECADFLSETLRELHHDENGMLLDWQYIRAAEDQLHEPFDEISFEEAQNTFSEISKPLFTANTKDII